MASDSSFPEARVTYTSAATTTKRKGSFRAGGSTTTSDPAAITPEQ